MIEITPEAQRQYRLAAHWAHQESTRNYRDICIALRDMTAEVMRLEFAAEHKPYISAIQGYRCAACCHGIDGALKERCDPRHNYTEADWQRAAHDALSGGKSDGND